MSDVHHQTELVIGGRPIVDRADGRTGLVVLPVDFRLDPTVPATRAECPPPVNANGVRRFGYPDERRHRMCPHYHCRHNLWHVADEDRPGRRWHAGELPPETPQLGLAGVDQRGPRQHDSESENTLELYTLDNCALDVLDARAPRGNDDRRRLPMTNAEIGEVLGTTERQVRRVWRKAVVKALGEERAQRLFAEMKER